MSRKFLPFFLALLVGLSSLQAQSFSETDYLLGYAQRGDTSWFLFDPDLYGLSMPERVVVTGSFRAWSTDMEAPGFQLQDGRLALPNPGFANIPVRAEFKFRVGEGEWLAPPTEAPNGNGQNLVFMHERTPPMLKAELLASGNIWARISGTARPLSPEAYRLTDAKGNAIPLARVLPNTDTEILLVPARPIDIRRVHYLEIPEADLRAWCNFDGWFRTLYSDKPLGANIESGRTVFRVFAPRADSVKLFLYETASTDEPLSVWRMKKDNAGVWEQDFDGNLKGTWYDFTVHGVDEPGNHFYGTTPVHVSDPYARVNDDAWGRSRVWPATQPATPLRNGIPPLESVIAYEVHVQDFTRQLPVDEAEKGCFPAFHRPGLTNSKGEPIGFDYLVDLGINVVHLMPVQEYMHYPDSLWRASFEDDPYMIEQGINTENYQWGYRTSHAFAVENRYRQKGSEPGAERDQFRDLVQAFHDRDLAVIIDIVPNHTAENMDDEPHFFHWNVFDKIYHYRTRDLDHIGEYGNEVKFENRPMVQRWLIDQCLHFIEEFGVDGFRVDLAGQVDRQTLLALRAAVGPDIIIYGEPWIGSNDPDFENNPSWDWYKYNSPICFFQDEARNAYKGPTSNPQEKERDRGYAGANFREYPNVKLALSARLPDDETPNSGIAYLDIHDNWALADRFGTENWDGRMGVDEDRYKLAAVLLYTTVGPIVTHGGSEMMRSKGHAPLEEIVKTMDNGNKQYFHGKRDTYNLRIANEFVWENVGRNAQEEGVHCNYDEMHRFWRGLNHFRLSDYGAVFRRGDSLPPSYYRFIETPNPYQLAYFVDDRVLVVMNTGSNEHDWPSIELPAGNWRLVGSLEGVDPEKGVSAFNPDYETLSGGQSISLTLPGRNFLMWVRE